MGVFLIIDDYANRSISVCNSGTKGMIPLVGVQRATPFAERKEKHHGETLGRTLHPVHRQLYRPLPFLYLLR